MPNDFFGSSGIAAFKAFATDTITITREGQNTAGAMFAPTVTVYQGQGDLQEGGGSTFYNPSGVAEVSDAVLIISTDALPDVQVGDIVTRTSNSKVFAVASTSLRDSLLPHLEIQLHIGPVKDEQQQ